MTIFNVVLRLQREKFLFPPKKTHPLKILLIDYLDFDLEIWILIKVSMNFISVK